MPGPTNAADSIDTVALACAVRGVDLGAVTSVGRYNDTVRREFHLHGDDDRAVLVLGNTVAMWPHVERYVVEAGEPVTDPVDRYVTDVVHGALAAAGVEPIDLRFDFEPPARRVAIQQIAHVAGLAWLSPSHLCVHPTFGPWMALRAAVVFDVAVGDLARPLALPLDAPCDCSVNCGPVLQQALAAGEPTNQAELRERWRLWLAVRDACPVGRAHRYGDEQIRYHYNGERPAHWPA